MNEPLIDRQTIVDALNEASRRIADRIDELGLTASGKTARSLHVETTPLGAMLLGRPRFYTLEEGTSPEDAHAQAKDVYEFRKIIEEWARDKGFKKPKLAEWTARIWWEGSKLYRSGETLDVYSTILDEELERLRQTLQIKVAKTVAQQLFMI